jgi:hypothetical protein
LALFRGRRRHLHAAVVLVIVNGFGNFRVGAKNFLLPITVFQAVIGPLSENFRVFRKFFLHPFPRIWMGYRMGFWEL